MNSFGDHLEFGKLKIAFFVMIFFHNFSESGYGKPATLIWLLFLMCSIVIRTEPGQEDRRACPLTPRGEKGRILSPLEPPPEVMWEGDPAV